jgi:hypothetical protein
MRRIDSNMTTTGIPERRSERGSALIIATLVSVILSLLGISYMMMAKTENTIAENERNSAMALYVAESGARLAVNWFNDPSSTGYLVPTSAQVDRSLRLLDQDNDPNTPRVLAASGNSTKPIYKDSSFTLSPIFDRPYRASLPETFLGIETGTDSDPNNATKGPDLVVSQSFLDTLNDSLFPNFPRPSLRAKISRIEVYAPPLLTLGGASTRMGIATIKVTGGVFLYPGTSDERQIATRVVKAVVNEIPVPGPVGPLQSCAGMDYQAEFMVHWGTGSSQGDASLQLSPLDGKQHSGLPYALNDPFTYYSDATPHNLSTWANDPAINGNGIDDPWFKFIAGGVISGAPAGPQPYPMSTYYPGSGTGGNGSHTNLFQNTVINCPTFDYNLWKSISQSGSKGSYYYKWSSADQFLLDGTGSPVSFANATSGKTGIFFFDTTNASAPFGNWTDPQYPGSGSTSGYTNLTPAFNISSAAGWQGVAGFVYLNTKQWSTTGSGSAGSTQTIFPPAEPSDGSGFVNLQWPTSFASSSSAGAYTVSETTARPAAFTDPVTNIQYCVDAATCPAPPGVMMPSATPVLDQVGLPFQDNTVLNGVMYMSGTYSSQGNANYYGSLVANQGVVNGGGTPNFWFDESLIKGGWPRKGMNMPRVIVSAWEVGL